MAMMMTGRVLLVCALCVLWCSGAGWAYARDLDSNALGGCMASGGFGENTSCLPSGCNTSASALSLWSALPATVMQANANEEEGEGSPDEVNSLSSSVNSAGGGGGGSGGGSGPSVGGDGASGSRGRAGATPEISTLNPPTFAGVSSRRSEGETGTTDGVLSNTMGKPKKEVQLPEETGTKNISPLSGHAAGAPNTGAQHQNPVTGGAQSVGNAAMLSSNSQASLREKTRENGESMGHETKDVSEGQHKQPADSGKALAGLSNAKTPEAETQRPKTASANEKNDSRNTNVSTTLPDAKEG
ncbi:mucin-associated surface protein (MASP), putative, partial [Trypanosoma cruzi marinkellei]